MKYSDERFNQNTNILIPGVGPYDIPEIFGEVYEPCEFEPFDKMNVCKWPEDTCLHFFRDDYVFERVWRKPDYYIDKMRPFKAVMSPDFSMYTDWPIAVQIFSHYKKHYLAARMQEAGMTVYPTINWSDERSFAWCFDGEPKHATVCVSSVGITRDKEERMAFLAGYEAMMETLEPETILYYGNIIKGVTGNIIPIESFSKSIARRCKKW